MIIKMRPHTRTQCLDANRCQECNPQKTTEAAAAAAAASSSSATSTSATSTITTTTTTTTTVNTETRPLFLVELPAEIIVKIVRYLSFKETSQLRLVCRRFNEISASMLNSTFHRLQDHMLQRFQTIKAKMPRRESARRNHPLARESDIIETLHMRLTLLQMTFGKHIERKHVCFFAGEILDEVFRILNYIKQTPNLGRAYKVTDELFDLSTMAMEYFKEHIEPTLPEISYFGAEFLDFSTPYASPSKKRNQSGSVDSPCSSRASLAGSSCSEPWSSTTSLESVVEPDVLPPSNMVLRKRIRRIRQGMKKYNDQLAEVKRELKSCKSKMEAQTKIVQDYSQRLEQYDQKFEESSRKFQTLLTELNKCKTELQYWRSKSAAAAAAAASSATCLRCDAPLEEDNNGLENVAGTDKIPENHHAPPSTSSTGAGTSSSSGLEENNAAAAGPVGRKRRSRDEDIVVVSTVVTPGSSEDHLILSPQQEPVSASRKSLRGIGVKNTSTTTRAAAAAAAAAASSGVAAAATAAAAAKRPKIY